MPARRKKRLALRSTDGTFTVELDGQPLTFVSHVVLVADANGAAEARLTVPGELVAIDAEAEAFITAHTPTGDDDSVSTHEPTVHVALSDLDQNTIDAAVRRVLWRDKLRDLRDPGRYFRR